MAKQFSRTELKMMVYRRTKEGMSYEDATKEVENLIKEVEKTKDGIKKKKRK